MRSALEVEYIDTTEGGQVNGVHIIALLRATYDHKLLKIRRWEGLYVSSKTIPKTLHSQLADGCCSHRAEYFMCQYSYRYKGW